MGDDRYSASELRQRYGPGGSLKDSELSASQVRARHGIQNYSGGGADNTCSCTTIVALVLAVATAVGGLLLYRKLN